jgi:hypothetical protein
VDCATLREANGSCDDFSGTTHRSGEGCLALRYRSWITSDVLRSSELGRYHSVRKLPVTLIRRTTIGLALLGGVGAVGVGDASAAAAPGAVTGAVTSVKPTSAVVSGAVNPNGASTTWYFEYGSTTSYGSKTPANTASGSSTVSVSATIAGLAPATSYHYRLVATSSAGTSAGADGIFSTSAVPNVVTEPTSGLGSTTTTLNGLVNAEGLSTAWYFEYGTTTKFGSKTPKKVVVPGPGNTSVSAPLTALTPHTKYYYRLRGSSSAGSSVGATLTFTTGLPITLNANTFTVVYGGPVTLSGVIDSKASGVSVTVLEERFDRTSFAGVATATTGSGGVWNYVANPSARTTFEASGNGGTSSPVVIGVRPSVLLVVLPGARFQTKVIGYLPFANRILQLQRLSHGTWVTVKREQMNGSGKAIFPASLLPRGTTLVRTAIGPDVIGPDQSALGMLAGYSAARSYHRG